MSLTTIKPKLLLALPNVDISYVKSMTGIFNRHFSKLSYHSTSVSRQTELAMQCARSGADLILTTSFATLKVVSPHLEGTAKDNYGTIVEFEGLRKQKIRMILVPSFLTIYSQNYGAFLLETYCSKLAHGGLLKKDRFTWEFLTPQNLSMAQLSATESFLCGVDIETSKEDLKITSCSYTFVFSNCGVVRTQTYVIPCNRENYPFCIDAIRVLNNTSVPKVMQNGKYDAAYFVRFNAPLHNWIYDTATMQHCLFPELPKDLSFISAMYLDNYRFWKDEAGRNLYEYNGKDTHNTVWVFMAQLMYIEKYHCEYALRNYQMEFPVLFPALSGGLDGFFVEEEIRLKLRAEAEEKVQRSLARLRLLIGEPDFNPGSPKQVKELMQIMGERTPDSSDEKALVKFGDKNVLNQLLVKLILEYRGESKAISTYFDMKLLNNRLLYSADPGGTETGRLSSASSAFWVGANIQNQPQYCRQMMRADEGWMLCAVDKAQSESYCTGYISQDLKLIHNVTTSPDFHCGNASMFFGIPFEKLWDEVNKKCLMPAIRKLAKPVNHGANYNMGPDVLVDTMGVKEVIKARKLLNLPMIYKPKDVATYLLAQFDKTYPRIRGDWYNEIVKEIVTTGKLYIPAVGWTRRTFLRPLKSKSDLNAAVAHKPQCTSVVLVNKALVKIWRELQIKKYRGKFRLKAQVHDEIVSQVRPEILDAAAQEVADMMTIPTEVEGRLMTIPSTIAKGYYWSEAK